MKHLLLTITYDGTGFHGWQRQPGQRTVQGELERVLSILCKEEISIAGASRTDAGVHAYGQRAGFSGDFGIPVEKLALAANRLMDKDVRILEVFEVSEEFHPRFDATGKTYIYKIRNSREPDVMMRNFHYHVEKPLDLTAMQEAATYLVGEQDFRSFLAAGGKEPETTVRRVTSAECYPDDGDIVFEVTGNGFLYNMVRIITGTLVEIGLGKRAPGDMKTIIERCDRRCAGHTAPPQGLYLKEVYYAESEFDRGAREKKERRKMKISDLYKQKKTVMSLEIFPPKLDSPVEVIYDTLDALSDLKPDFISVTYGAGGKAKDRTIEIAAKIKNDYGIESVAHLTCISATKEQIKENFRTMREGNVENILAMRGDIPEDPEFEFPNPLQYEHAADLIAEAHRERDFCIGGACYPEGHIDAVSKVQDIKYLKAKVDKGTDFLISQLFFDNELFFRFMEEIDLAGISVPVSAGIMPVLNKKQILRITQLSGCSIPPKLQRILDRYEDNPAAMKEAGEAFAIEQIIDLMAWGVRGIHLYTMNKPETARRIMGNIEAIRSLQG